MIKRAVSRTVLLVSFGFLVMFAFVGTKREQGTLAATEYQTPSSIVADCSVNVTVDLQNWINSVPDNATLKFGASACYRIDGTLKFIDRNNLIIDGNNATFKAVTSGRELPPRDARTRFHFNFEKGTNLLIRNAIVKGANPYAGVGDLAYVVDLEAQHAFNIYSVQGLTIENSQAYDTYGDFVYIGNQRGDLSRNITIRNNHFERNGRQAIAVTGGEDILIENNFISQVRRATVDIESNSSEGAVRRFMFRNNDIGPGRLLFFANKGADASIEDITFEGNRLTGRPMNVTSSTTSENGRRKRYKFINNVSDKVHGSGNQYTMYFKGITDLEVRGNVQPAQATRGMSLVAIDQVSGTKVTSNTGLNYVSSMRLGTGNTNYCYSDNLINNPLVTEASAFPCGQAPNPTVPPPPDVTVPPTDPEDDIVSPTAQVNKPKSTVGAVPAPASDPQYGPVSDEPQKDQNLAGKLYQETEPKTHVGFWGRIGRAFTNIPPTLGDVAANPSSLPDMVQEPMQRDSLIASSTLFFVMAGTSEAIYLIKRHRDRLRKYWAHHIFDPKYKPDPNLSGATGTIIRPNNTYVNNSPTPPEPDIAPHNDNQSV